MEDEFLVFGEDLFEIGAVGVHPEFQHAAWAVEAAGDEAAALAFARVAQIDDLDGRIIHQGDGIGGGDFFDARTCGGDHFGCCGFGGHVNS